MNLQNQFFKFRRKARVACPLDAGDFNDLFPGIWERFGYYLRMRKLTMNSKGFFIKPVGTNRAVGQ